MKKTTKVVLAIGSILILLAAGLFVFFSGLGGVPCFLPEPEPPKCVVSHDSFVGHKCVDGVWKQGWSSDGMGWQKPQVTYGNRCR